MKNNFPLITFDQKDNSLFTRGFLGTLLFLVMMMLITTPTVSAQTTIGSLTQGQVVQVTPEDGSDPYKLMYTGNSEDGAGYFVMLDNYCTWGSSACTQEYGTPWNSTSWEEDCTAGSTIGRCNDIGGSRKNNNFLIQLENFYNSLPSIIGDMEKATAIPKRNFNMISPTTSWNTNSITNADCRISTNSTPYGNIGTTFVGTIGQTGGACAMNSRVSLLSYEEWQGGLLGTGHYPTGSSIGHAFCQTRFGIECSNNGNYGLFASNTDKPHFILWLRSPAASDASHVWNILGYGELQSVNAFVVYNELGILPAFWLSSSISLDGTGEGTYASPFNLVVVNNNNSGSLSSPTGNHNFGTLSGVADPASLVSFDQAANQDVQVQVIVGDSIGLDCADSVNLGQIVGFGRVMGKVPCNVFTNHDNGYSVMINSMSPIALNTTQEGGNPVGLSATINEKLLPYPTDMTDQEKAVWALSPNDGNTWFGIGDIIRTKNSPSATTGDNFLVTVGAHIGSDMILEAGSYVGSFTLTATTI